MRSTGFSKPTHTELISIALVGNPNTGKSTLFGALTGIRQRVGNYPGVTVEQKVGRMSIGDDRRPADLIDLPGTYSLAAQSADEAVVLDALAGTGMATGTPSLAVVVVDATNLQRNLFLTTQLIELGVPIVVALNMVDAAEDAGIHVDAGALSEALGVPVVPVVAHKRCGIDALRIAMADTIGQRPSPIELELPAPVRAELDGLTELVRSTAGEADRVPARVALLQALLDKGGYQERHLLKQFGESLADDLADRRARIEQAGLSIGAVEAQARYARIGDIIERVVPSKSAVARSRSELADRVLTHRLWGLAVLILIMGTCFQSIYAWAAPLMDAVDTAFASLSAYAATHIPAGALQSLVLDGVIAGVGGVLIFLPQILVLFLFIAILEDCGYMARTAFLLDRWMALIGLSGKSFIPLLSSFACAVPGIMATKTIESERDRKLTIAVAPLMSCSARLPVYVLFVAAFVPDTQFLGGVVGLQAITLASMSMVGLVVAIPVAWILKATVLKGKPEPFLMELPAYRLPSVRTVLLRIYTQGRAFVVSAGTIIFAITIIVWALGYYPRPAEIGERFENQRQAVMADTGPSDTVIHERLAEIDRAESGAYLKQSLLARMGHLIEPVVEPLGWDWRIGTAVIASFPAREVVIATLGTIYNLGSDQDEASAGLRKKLQTAKHPDGRLVFNVPVALSIMVFFALCCQCGATLATIRRQTGSWRWPVATFAYMTVLGYLGALATYNIAVLFT